ncbi:hypothetical protein Moror_6243 [Moniliophthora roreri MCA 2997]|uniref:Uncharacterized protein n=1 Tax=Moniliophthora roreri (strain MCA 2997) TaxID=1381753 RepID=V2WW44_MONRO|nr:hypothetical protein Moror_6243 [Moniliophthora roreri MCA 2997]
MPKTMLLVVDGSVHGNVDYAPEAHAKHSQTGLEPPLPAPVPLLPPGARRRRLNPDIDTGTMFASYSQFQLHPNMPPSQTSPKICDVLITLNSPPSTPSPQSPLLLPPPKHSRLVVASVYTDNDYLVVFVVPEAKGKALELSMMLDWLGQG